MIFTDEQFETLSQWEEYYREMRDAQVARYSGKDALQRMHRIYKEATGDRTPLRISCGRCYAQLYKDIAKVYFEDKAERERMKAKPKRVARKRREDAV